jgi:hypothetical protein
LTRRLQIGLPLAFIAAASMWFYVDGILIGHQITDAAAHDRPRGNLSDLYPRWLGTRELLLHRRNPYSPEITSEIQKGYYGRVLDASRPNDPKDQQAFAYPVYVVFLLAPLIGLSFHTVQIIFHWLLIGLTGAGVVLWLRALKWRLSPVVIAIALMLTLGSIPAVQGIKLQQLSLLVAAMLAASAACVASGYLFSGGVILALATIKPQLAWLVVAWLLLWSLSDWKVRQRFLIGFAATMGVLLIGAEFILPGWWRMFLHAMRQYHQYTQNESVLDLSVNWCIGRFGGTILAALAVLFTGSMTWSARKAPANAPEFAASLALTMALTVLIVPMYAPYNQVLLLPALLWLWKNREAMAQSRPVRLGFGIVELALAWPWIASLGLTALWFVSPESAIGAWTFPLYAVLALPVLVFALVIMGVRYSDRALRLRNAAE